MARSQVGAQLVIDAHQVGVDAFELPVHDDHGCAHPCQALQQVVILPYRPDHQPIDALFEQHAQVVALFLGIVVGIAQDHAVAIALAGVFNTSGQLGEVRVDAVGHEQADGGRAARLQRPRDGAGHVVQFPNGGLDFEPDRLAHRSRFIQHMGHCGVRNPRQRRNVFDGCHGSVPPGCAPATISVEHHGNDDHSPGNDALGRLTGPDLRKACRQHRNDEHAKKGADD